MLSESGRNGYSALFAEIRRALYTRTRAGRIAGIVAGGILEIGVAAGIVLAGPGSGLTTLLVVPVAALGWYGGIWFGRAAALLGGGAHLAAMVLSGTLAGVVPGVGLVATVAVLWLVGTAVPGLRFSAQSYRDHAQTDPLTNLGNRRFFREVAAVELNRSKRYRRPVSLVYLEADGLERIKRTAGHAAADTVLMQLAAVLTASLRSSDVVARISGGEFAILLPETTGDGARVVSEKLRERLVEAARSAGHELQFRAAIVGFGAGSVSLDAMLVQADRAMAQSRLSGTAGVTYRDYEHPPLQLV